MYPHLAIHFVSSFGRYPKFHTLTIVIQKKLLNVSEMLPLFRAVVKIKKEEA